MSVLLIAGGPSKRSRSAAVLKRVKHQLSQRGVLVERLRIRDLSSPDLLLADIGRPSVVSTIAKDDVVIYAGSTVRGRLTRRRGRAVGGNPWPTHEVAPGSRTTQMRSLDEVVANAMLHCPD